MGRNNNSLDYYVSVQAKEDEDGRLVMGHGESLGEFIDVCMKVKNTGWFWKHVIFKG